MLDIVTMVLVYLACLLVFLALDGVWLGLVSGSLYTAVLGDLLLDQFRIAPAILFYLLQVGGILLFVLPRCGQNRGPWRALVFGALFGVSTYGTYDLTNHAVLRVWTWQLTVTDMVWGAFVTGIASAAGFLVQRGRERA